MKLYYDLDLKEFWKENELCQKPFSTDKPRIPIMFWLDDHYVIEHMGIKSTLKFYEDDKYRQAIIEKFNRITEKELGRKFHDDGPPAPEPARFEVVMGAKLEIVEGGTPWLETSVENIDDVKKLISDIGGLDMKKEIFPPDWEEQKKEYEKATGKKLRLGGIRSRGPATIATSVLGTTNTCMFIMDEPDVMDEFFKLLGDRLVEYNKILMEDTGNETMEGYEFFDDNCFLFPPDQYERFCAPVLEKVFNEFAQGMFTKRFQHSDSDMGHLMGILHDIGVNAVNLGPSLEPKDIKATMPNTMILGQIPPFVLREGTPEEIVSFVRRDIDAAGGDGSLIECPAGSVPGGTSFENLRIYMWAVEKYGRY